MTYTFKTKPYKHQVRALKKALRRGCCALFMEMGTGKTKVAIDFACALGVKHQHQMRVLVVCPLSVTGVWPLEIEKHAPAGYPPTWKIINYDKARRPEVLAELINWLTEVDDDRRVIVLDEGHRIKNHSSLQSKSMYRLAQYSKYRLLLTGTPVGKNLLDLYAQFRFVKTSIFGTSWKVFKNTYAIFVGPNEIIFKRYRNKRKMLKKISPYTVRVKKKDCLDLPKATHELVPVMLDESAEFYEHFARESVARIEDNKLMADNVLVRIQKLSQMTGGFVKVDDKWHRIGKEKQLVLADQLSDFYAGGILKFGLFCHYLPELRVCMHVAKEAGYRVLPYYGGVRQELRDRILADFDETKKPTVFLATLGTGSLGIDLTAASTAVFYSHTDSFIDFRQTCDRFHRIGQFNPVTYYHYVARHDRFLTIDYGRMVALRRKRRMEHQVMTHPRLLLLGGRK